MTNIQVTHDTNLNNARSESSVAINPNNPRTIVAGSKKFNNIQNYDFTLATAYSTDGGYTWQDSDDLQLLAGWDGISDPAITWDDSGNVYLVALACKNPPVMNPIGIAIYKSINGGQTWSKPNFIHSSSGDDKQWAAADVNRYMSPFAGRVYAVWDDASKMRFARTLDHGNTWIGAGNDPVGSVISNDSFSPEINVATDGTIYIVWMGGDQIKMIISTDGGDSFHPGTPVATGITTLSSALQAPNGWPVFYPNGNFRVFTLPTACVGPSKEVVVSWADYREGISRIYYAFSDNGGNSWKTGPSGLPLLTSPLPANQQHFHPQIAFDGNRFGCAFYEFGPKPNTYMIDVKIAFSPAHYISFYESNNITDRPWDPTVDAPWVHGDPNTTFIGEYFGLDASNLGFYPVWTDTRTGIQELWTDVMTATPDPWDRYQQAAQILIGIINDAGGIEIVGGHLRRIPPRSPELDILLGIANHRIATFIVGSEGLELRKAAMNVVVKLAQKELRRLQNKNIQQLDRKTRNQRSNS